MELYPPALLEPGVPLLEFHVVSDDHASFGRPEVVKLVPPTEVTYGSAHGKELILVVNTPLL